MTSRIAPASILAVAASILDFRAINIAVRWLPNLDCQIADQQFVHWYAATLATPPAIALAGYVAAELFSMETSKSRIAGVLLSIATLMALGSSARPNT